MFRGSVKSTGYPLHSPVSPSLPLPCVTVCHHISTGLYKFTAAAEEFAAYIFSTGRPEFTFKNISQTAKTAIILTTLKFPSDINAKYSSHITLMAVHTNYVTSKWFNYNCKSE
jgi:hypothetical protein